MGKTVTAGLRSEADQKMFAQRFTQILVFTTTAHTTMPKIVSSVFERCLTRGVASNEEADKQSEDVQSDQPVAIPLPWLAQARQEKKRKREQDIEKLDNFRELAGKFLLKITQKDPKEDQAFLPSENGGNESDHEDLEPDDLEVPTRFKFWRN
jgi:hypothetical protein